VKHGHQEYRVNSVNSSAANRFERRPLLAWLLIVGFFLFMAESLLRIVAPDALRFAYDFRQAYRYHDRWYTDFEPDTTAHIHLASDNGYLLNFLVSVNDHGFRSADRPTKSRADADAPTRYIHAIGDSFTMGWGVNYESSYPALLDAMLEPEYEVLNLGLNGFGATAATEKSAQLLERYPPEHVVYLATGNDYDDDEAAYAYAQRPYLVHRFMDVVNWGRHNMYLVSVPFALRWWLYYRDARANAGVALFDSSASLSVRAVRGSSNPKTGEHSKRSLKKFAQTLRARRIPLLVVGHGDSDVVADIIRFCQEQSIESVLVDVPAALTLPGDGHFNARGNNQMAELIRSRLELELELEPT
jgi:lysophospholipase L1-like esterase